MKKVKIRPGADSSCRMKVMKEKEAQRRHEKKEKGVEPREMFCFCKLLTWGKSQTQNGCVLLKPKALSLHRDKPAQSRRKRDSVVEKENASENDLWCMV